MSLQQLVPEDILVRVLSIALDDNEVPSRHKTKDGPARRDNSNRINTIPGHIEYLIGEVKAFYKEEKLLNTKGKSETGKESTLSNDRSSSDEVVSDRNKNESSTVKVPHVKDCLSANKSAYKLAQTIFKDIDKSYKFSQGRYKFHLKMMIAADRFSMERTGYCVSDLTKNSFSNSAAPSFPIRAQYMSAATHLEAVRDSFNRAQDKHKKDMIRKGAMPDEVGTVSGHYIGNEKVRYTQIGSLVIVNYKEKYGWVSTYVMTTTHYARVIDLIKFYSNLRSVLPALSCVNEYDDILTDLRDRQLEIAIECPNSIGGIIKTARQIIFLRGDKSFVMGCRADIIFINGLDGDKANHSVDFADTLQEMFYSREDALNIANYFKAVFHPDSHMSDLFDSIENLKSPNKPDERILPRFNGVLRRATYDSLIKQKKDVRLIVNDDSDRVSVDFVRSVNSSSREVSSHLSAGYSHWASTRFCKVDGIYEQSIMGVSVSNKSSASEFSMSEDDFRDMNNDLKKLDEFDLRDKITTVNDIKSVFDGESNLDYERAKIRFLKVKELHERFESKEGCNNPEDISWEKLERFVVESPVAAYVVLTEPKLGEVHKKVSRLFYMAEQALKVMTQTAERIAKQASGKHAGVSITKGYQGRRREIEEMAHSYTGYTGDNNNTPDNLYISFDMSEFSKKFPMELVRIYGRMLSELTGEEWLSRLDLFFRSSIVMHKSRGYHAAMAGVKGGFEGFLNFTWSAIMATVMEIAKESCGVDGVLCAYSDDGVLRIYVQGTKSEQYGKLMKIQLAFKMHGLTFHFFKTCASYEIMEYLGEYIDEGRILSTWMKEFTSIGKRKGDSGLEFLSDKITRLCAQAGAVINAKGPTLEIVTLMYYLCALEIERGNSNYREDYYYLIQLIPYSMGGCRTPSFTELATISRIDSSQEIIADWEIFSVSQPNVINGITSQLIEFRKTPQESSFALLGGSLFQTYLPDVSCTDIVRDLLTEVKGPLANDPLTMSVRKTIVEGLESGINIKPKVIMNLIASVPDVVEYNKAIAITKSSAVLRFYDKSTIRRAQGSGTRRTKLAIRGWCERFRLKENDTPRFNVRDIVNNYFSLTFTGCSIDIGPESARVALKVASDDSKCDITTFFEVKNSDYLRSLEFNEPVKKFMSHQFTAEYSAEGGVDSRERRIKKFANYGAKLVAQDPAYLYLYYLIANAFNLPVPSPPSGTVMKDSKSGRTNSSVAVASMIESPYDALITSKITHSLYRAMKDIGSVDRTTYAEVARLITSTIIHADISPSDKLRPSVISISYNIRNKTLNMENKVFGLIYTPKFDKIDHKLTKSFTSILIEQENRNKRIESLIQSRSISDIQVSAPVIKALLLRNFTNWLYSATRTLNYAGFAPRSDYLPVSMKASIMMEAAVTVSFKLLIPLDRSIINRSMADFIYQCSGKSVYDACNDVKICSIFSNCVAKCGRSMTNLRTTLGKVFKSLKVLDLDLSVASRFDNPEVLDVNVRPHFITYIMRKNAISPDDVPVTVVSNNQFADQSMSPDLKKKIKDIIEGKTTSLLDKLSKPGYKSRGAFEDYAINDLTIIKAMLRSSGHRDTPFNSAMSGIESIKMDCFLRHHINKGTEGVEVRDLNQFRTPRDIVRSLLRNNVVLRGDKDSVAVSNNSGNEGKVGDIGMLYKGGDKIKSRRGQDYRDCLINKGVLAALLPRINYILRRLSHVFDRIIPQRIDMVSNWNLLLSTKMRLLGTYNNMIQKIVNTLSYFNTSQAYDITRLRLVTPVEEAKSWDVHCEFKSLGGSPIDLRNRELDKSMEELCLGLISMHSARWGIDKYNTEGCPFLSYELSKSGLTDRGGVVLSTYYETREIDNWNEEYIEAEFKVGLRIVAHRFENVNTAINSYMSINHRDLCMAIICRSSEVYYVLAIITPKTPISPGDNESETCFLQGLVEEFPIYEAERLRSDIVMLVGNLNLAETIMNSRAEAEFVAVSRAFHRESKVIKYIEEKDEFLVAISEVCRFGWSLSNARRVYVMVAAWLFKGESANMKHVRLIKKIMKKIEREGKEDEKVQMQRDMGLVWQWVKSRGISAGLEIDTVKVSNIVSKVGKSTRDGGVYITLTTMPPKSVNEVRQTIGDREGANLICRLSNYLYRAAVIESDDDSDSFYSDTNSEDEDDDDEAFINWGKGLRSRKT